MFPFFIEALQDLKTSETVESFKQMGQILLLLEDVINEDIGFKLDCLNRFIDPNDQDAKGPEDMIKILEKGANIYSVLNPQWTGWFGTGKYKLVPAFELKSKDVFSCLSRSVSLFQHAKFIYQ